MQNNIRAVRNTEPSFRAKSKINKTLINATLENFLDLANKIPTFENVFVVLECYYGYRGDLILA